MVSLLDKLRFLHPDADILLFGLADDGTGQIISDWQQPFTQPTDAELDSIEDSKVASWLEKQKIPSVVEMRQARLYLESVGLLDNIDAQIAAMDKTAQIEWGFAKTVDRNHPLVQGMNFTEEQLDTMFQEASKI